MPALRVRVVLRAAAAVLAVAVAWPAVAARPVEAQDSGSDRAGADPVEAQDSGADRAGSGSSRVACDEASEVFELLCDTYGLIASQYVDPVRNQVLAAAAARGVRQAGLRASDDRTAPACALPAPDFEQACVEIVAVADTAAAVWAAAQGMLASLGDLNTYLMTSEQHDAFVAELEAGPLYSGIGLRVGLLDGDAPCSAVSASCRVVVSEVFQGSPADRAGLMADDILVELNGLVPAGPGCGLDSRHRVGAGTPATVRVERDGRVLDFVAVAEMLAVPVAAGRVVGDGIGYLRLDTFSESADERLGDELQTLLDSGVRALVLDLRGNLGGYLRAVVSIAGLFLNDGDVVAREYSRHGTLQHLAGGPGVAADPAVLPMVVAVDGSSASASELLALALRDHGRATIVGATTFGKSTGQITQTLESDDGAVLGAAHLTTLRWLSPNGVSAAGGVEPDVAVYLSPCLHPIGLARQAAAAARLQGATFVDIAGGSVHSEALEALAAGGVFAGTECEPGLLCPDEPATRWMLAVWLARIVDGSDPEAASVARFVDVDSGDWWAAHVERLAELGITAGCARAPARFCPDEPVTRAQLASFLRRAFSLDPAVSAGFSDTRGSLAAADIDALFAAGITEGCAAEPLRFCPGRLASRAEAATFLDRARGR